MWNKTFYIVFFLISLFSLGLCEEKPEELPEIVVTANRIPEYLEETTAKTVLIPYEEIQKTNVILISDLLRTAPGVYVTSFGGPGKPTGIILNRSIRSSHTLVLLDGIKVNDPTTGMFDFGSLNAEDVERIEIIEGPQSTLYGSEAIGGVINIITKKGKEKPKINLSLESGSYGTYKPNFEISGEIKNWNFRLNSSYYNTEGFSAYRDGKEKDGFKNSFLSGKTGLNILPSLNIEFIGRYNYEKTEFDFPSSDANNIKKAKNYLLAGNINFEIFKNWKQYLLLSKNYSQRKHYYYDFGFSTNYIVQTNEFHWQNEVLPFEFYNLIFGIEYRKEKGKYEGYYDKERENMGFFINNKLNLFQKKLILNFGLRYDDYKKFGEKTTYRLGLNYLIPQLDIRLKANYGTGFMVPTFDDLFYPDEIWAKGNPNLKPEESKGWDIGIEKSLWNNKIDFSLIFFYQRYKNLIEWIPINWVWQPQNIGSAIIKGFENNLSFHLAQNFSFKISYNYSDPEDKEINKYLRYKPQHKLCFSADYTKGNFSFLTQYIYTGERYADKKNKNKLESYSLINLSSNYKLKSNIVFFGRIENLLNTDYEEVKNYNTPGRSIYLGLKLDY